MRSFDEPIVSCPYNPEHKMKHSRLIWHIGKGCKEKELYEHLYGVCSYNALHIIKKEDLPEHMNSCPDKGKYVVYETKEDELAKALNSDLKVEEHKMGENPQTNIDPWCTNVKLMQQYEIKDWYSDSYNQTYQVMANQTVSTQATQAGDMEIESQKGWPTFSWSNNDDGWGNDSNENNLVKEAGFGGVTEEKPLEPTNVGTW